MKKVVKVSLSGKAFTLAEDADALLREYLTRFEEHYRNNPNSPEIMEGIEGRMAELLYERRAEDSVVSAGMAQEVIDIIGHPEDVFGESDTACDNPKNKGGKHRKKLFRDTSDKVIAGVCSGLAAYFSTEPRWFRIGFAAATLLSWVLLWLHVFSLNYISLTGLSWHAGFTVLIYFVLALIIPAADTAAKKCDMRGVSPNYAGIQKEVEDRNGTKSGKGASHGIFSIMARCFGIFIGLLLAVIGFSGILIIVLAFFGIAIGGISLPQILESLFSSAMDVSADMMYLIRTLCTLAIFLPFVGMLYGGIKLLFKFRTPKWRPGLVILLLWVFSLVGTAFVAIRYTLDMHPSTPAYEKVILDECPDKLHIELEDIDKWKHKLIVFNGDKDEYDLACIDVTDKSDIKAAIYPKVHRENGDKSSIYASSYYITDRLDPEDLASELKQSCCRVSNDTLYLYPVLIGESEKPLRELRPYVAIKAPKDVRLEVEEPIAHNFDKRHSYTNIKDPMLKMFFKLLHL